MTTLSEIETLEQIEKRARWTCEGSVRGCCGRSHKTRESAADHCSRDQANCAGITGGNAYSDRSIVAENDAAELIDALAIRDTRAVCRALIAAGATDRHNYALTLDGALAQFDIAKVSEIINQVEVTHD